MIVLNIFFVFLFFIIFSDLYINYFPRTNLVLVPQDYKLRKKDNKTEVVIDINDSSFSVESFNEYNSIISEKK